MELWQIILIAAVGVFFLFIVVPTVLAFIAVFIRKEAPTPEEYDWEKYKDHYYIPYVGRILAARDTIKKRKCTEVEVTSYDGLKLYGDYYDMGAKRTAILFHGLGANMYLNFPAQAEFFCKNGFNVLLICQRGHGKSKGRWTTIGLKEQYDVLTWIDWADKGGAEEIVIYGLSMGAAAIAYAADRIDNPKVRCMILDSCYYSIYEQMKRDAYKNHLPKILLFTEWVMAQLVLNVNIRASTAKAISKAKKPVLVIHGENDLTVDPKWGKLIYDSCPEPKEFLFVKNGPHTLNFLEAPELVGNTVLSFINKYFNKKQ